MWHLALHDVTSMGHNMEHRMLCVTTHQHATQRDTRCSQDSATTRQTFAYLMQCFFGERFPIINNKPGTSTMEASSAFLFLVNPTIKIHGSKWDPFVLTTACSARRTKCPETFVEKLDYSLISSISFMRQERARGGSFRGAKMGIPWSFAKKHENRWADSKRSYAAAYLG
eukprot:gene16359-biopygen8242